MPRGTLIDREFETLIGPRLEQAEEASRGLLDRYRLDPWAHCDDGHVWVLDLETMQPIPLVPWPHQKELVEEWLDLDYLRETGVLRFRNIHEEKSRQMGMTWIIAWVCCWILKYHPVAGLALSLKANDLADSGFTADSFFGRIKFIAEFQGDEQVPLGFPPHLRPRFHYVGGNDPAIRNTDLSRATLTGSGAVPDPGRGKRYAYVFVDEAARLPFGRQVQASITLACPTGRLYNSTPEGEDNIFGWLKKERPANISFLRHHWSIHPVYSRGLHVAGEDPKCSLCQGNAKGVGWSPALPLAHRYPGKLTSLWYDNAILGMTDEEVASELEIDYAASLTARVYPEFTEELHVAEVVIPYEPNVELELAWDYGVDTTAVAIFQDTPFEYRALGGVEVHDATPELVASAVRAELLAIGVPELMVKHEWTKRMLGRGDPAGEARQQATGRSLISEYAAQGFSISSTPMKIDYTIRAVKRLLLGIPKPLIVSPRFVDLIDHAKHNRWPTDRQGNRKPGVTEPLNDRHNHMMRAIAYLIAYKFPPPEDLTAVLREAAPRDGGESGKIDPGIQPSMQF